MNMDQKELSKIISSSLSEKALSPADIPSLDLYLDQILTLFSEKTDGSGRNGALTKTMINNYSKNGLIKPIKGKKYSKEHIIQMMIIYYLKGVLSIGDIKRIFDGIYSDSDFDGERMISSYDRFLSIRATENELCRDMIAHLTDKTGLDPERSDDLFILLMSIVSICDSLKNSALEIIDREYPSADKPQVKEKVKEKKSKKSENESTSKSEKKAAKKKEQNKKEEDSTPSENQ